MLGLGLLVVMLCVAAGGSSQSLAGQVSVALLTFVAFLFSSRMILNHWSHGQHFETDAQQSLVVSDNGRTNLLFSALALSMILMATSAVAHVTSRVLPDLQGLVHDSLTSSLDAVTTNTIVSTSKYVRGNRIGSVRRHMTHEPAEIALTAYSSVRPGYLKGSAFDDYDSAYWAPIQNDELPRSEQTSSIQPRVFGPAGNATVRLEGPSSRPLKRFVINRSESQNFATLEVHNKPLKGHVFFVPMNLRWIECNARSVRVSSNDVVEHGPDLANPYVLGIDLQPTIDEMDPARRDLLLKLPQDVKATCDEVAEELCGKHTNAHDKAAAVRQYFQNNFEYSLRGVRFNNADDPVVRFLNLKHPANCELFASATALILRSAGVPTRYITGYVATEFNSEKDSWIARNRDAHAWVEAYDDSTKTWFPVESTPGRNYQSLLTDGSSGLSATSLNNDADRTNADEDNIFSKAFGWVMSMRATDPLIFVFRLIQVPLFLLVVYLLWKRFVRGDGSELNPEDVKSKLMLAKVDRILGKHQLVRSPYETLHQFAARVEEYAKQASQKQQFRAGVGNAADKKFQAYANWYRQFAESRYQGQMPAPLAL